MDRFEIELEVTPLTVHVPGETLTGNVVIVNSTPMEFQEITMEIKGVATVSWFDLTRFKRRIAQETYFNETICILRNTDGGCVKQQPGEHRYPFTFLLPDNIPSSYKNYVKYNMKASIIRPSGKVYATCKLPFTVQSVVDLNEDANAKIPLRVRQRADAGDDGKFIRVEAWLDKTGFASGETIRFNAKIENNRNEPVRQSKVQLIQNTILADDKNRQHKIEKLIYKAEKGSIPADSCLEWSRFPIVLPQLPPSRFPHCKLIDVSYVILLVVDPGLAYTNVVAPLDIIIGTVRLRKPSPSSADYIRQTVNQVCENIRRLSRLSVSGRVSDIRKRKSYRKSEPA